MKDGRPDSGFERGFAVLPPLLDASECKRLAEGLPETRSLSGGDRCLLELTWCAELAVRLGRVPAIAARLPRGAVAVQCSYFEKSAERNWLVPLHQDLSIPVAERLPAPGLGPWSEKQGQVFVQAPVALLEQLLAVRLHLDECSAEQGALRVVPGSQQQGVLTPNAGLLWRERLGETLCPVAAGGVMLMRPLLLHASSKSRAAGRRRVLHFLFGPPDLPHGLRWRREVPV